MRPQRRGEVVRASYTGVGEAMRLDGVQAAADKRARDIAGNARILARGAGIDVTFTVATTIRKGRKKRPEAQIYAETEDAEERAHLLSLLQAAGRVV